MSRRYPITTGLFEIGKFSNLCGIASHILRNMHADGRFVPDLVLPSGYRYYSSKRIDEASKLAWKPKIIDGGKNVIVDCQDLEHDFAYVWGLIMADGSVMGDGKTICLEMKDKQIIDDVARIVEGNVHSRTNRKMWRVIIPRKYSRRLISLGIKRRKRLGFIVPSMSENTFCDYLRGLFDGDGSVGRKGNGSLRCAIAGNPVPMAYIQKTLFEHFELYMAWSGKKSMDYRSGHLEIANKESVSKFRDIIYRFDGPCLVRKKEIFLGLAA